MVEFEGVVKDGVPVCPTCDEPMVWTGLELPTRETPLFRCARCGTEFPPVEARVGLGVRRPKRRWRWVLLVMLGLVVLALIPMLALIR